MKMKKKVLLIDDEFQSEKQFWTRHNNKSKFESNYELDVFKYPKNENLAEQEKDILSFLSEKTESSKTENPASVLLLDMRFPGAEEGGCRIIKLIKSNEIDKDAIRTCSS